MTDELDRAERRVRAALAALRGRSESEAFWRGFDVAAGAATEAVRRGRRIDVDAWRASRTVHKLKTWPAAFALVWSGDKPYEVRKDDRGFEVGHGLELVEFEPHEICRGSGAYEGPAGVDVECGGCAPPHGVYTGRVVLAEVTSRSADAWGLPPGLCVLGFKIVARVGATGQGG